MSDYAGYRSILSLDQGEDVCLSALRESTYANFAAIGVKFTNRVGGLDEPVLWGGTVFSHLFVIFH